MISFLAVIPACSFILSPFFHISPPPAETPKLPVKIVLVASPAETSNPPQPSFLCSFILSFLVSIFRLPSVLISTVSPAIVLPIRLVSFPEFIVVFPPDLILLPL